MFDVYNVVWRSKTLCIISINEQEPAVHSFTLSTFSFILGTPQTEFVWLHFRMKLRSIFNLELRIEFISK